MRQVAPGTARMGQVAQPIKQVAHGVVPLRRIFAHQAEVRGHKGSFFVLDITGVGTNGGHPPNFAISS